MLSRRDQIEKMGPVIQLLAPKGMRTRIISALQSVDIWTIGDLLDRRNELGFIPNFHKKSAAIVATILSQYVDPRPNAMPWWEFSF